MEQPSNINITPIDRAFLQGQGILKGMGSQIKKRKMQKQPTPKKKMAPKGKMMDMPRIIDMEKISKQDVKAQGGKTPSSVVKEIQKNKSYGVKFGPGLYKSKKK